jgi:hypothetical protein
MRGVARLAALGLAAMLAVTACNEVAGTAGGFVRSPDPVDAGVPDQLEVRLWPDGAWDGPPDVALEADLTKPALPAHNGQLAQDAQAGVGTVVDHVAPPGHFAEPTTARPVVWIVDLKVDEAKSGQPARTLVEETRTGPSTLTQTSLNAQWNPTDSDHQDE